MRLWWCYWAVCVAGWFIGQRRNDPEAHTHPTKYKHKSRERRKENIYLPTSSLYAGLCGRVGSLAWPRWRTVGPRKLPRSKPLVVWVFGFFVVYVWGCRCVYVCVCDRLGGGRQHPPHTHTHTHPINTPIPKPTPTTKITKRRTWDLDPPPVQQHCGARFGARGDEPLRAGQCLLFVVVNVVVCCGVHTWVIRARAHTSTRTAHTPENRHRSTHIRTRTYI